MAIRDRIKELRRVRAGDLRPNPRNWRTHPDRQQSALRGVLEEIGYAGALLARERSDGSLELIDGHLRAQTTPEELVPVLVLDVDENEAAKLLAVFDPLSAMAGTDDDALTVLLKDVHGDTAGFQQLLSELAGSLPDAIGDAGHALASADQIIPQAFQVVVECDDESQQRNVYERMTSEGFLCRLLML